ncbi:histidine kinase [Halomonas cupida]|uniref:histidine kinase n=1 Tax=Halomonas cupida TaxID=44933 RepID=A0A1M7A8E7_9GAMM|nr:ATP-binding protein [Halomonas cupida]GEN22495.1 histidine kinase [Halomonas cupida]SHL38898.1 two-component system, NarL family, sensor histidine kinase BarA [Halomonas cupida]
MSLKSRLMLALLGLPMLLLTLMASLSLYHENSLRQSAMQARINDAVDLLAPQLGEALAMNDAAALQKAANQLMDSPSIRALRLQRGNQSVLEFGRLRGEALAVSPSGERRLMQHYRQWVVVVPLAQTQDAWLILDVDASLLLLANYSDLARAALILLVCGLLLFLVAFSLSRRITQPLDDMSHLLDQLSLGRQPPHMPVDKPAELAELAARINALADHMAEAREDLNHQIESATRELQESMETIEVQNIELDISHRQAVEANRVKSEFLANMSHEIRTPLNGIVGFCRLLGRSPLDQRQQEWLDQVQRACNNLLSLVNDVLDFSKLEAGRLVLEHVPVDIQTLVDEVLGLQAPLAHQKDLQLLSLVYDDVPPQLTGDPLRIRQVLTNLVNNAIKFTDHGEVIVRVMVEESHNDCVTLRLSVSDTGIGLTDIQQRRLSQAFRQATPSHSRQFGGTGLGLTISRQLVEQMGGSIGVDSTPEQGSTFHFTISLTGNPHLERMPELELHDCRFHVEEPHGPSRRALVHLATQWQATVVDEADHASVCLEAISARDLTGKRLAHLRQRLATRSCPTLLMLNAGLPDQASLALPPHIEILAKPISRKVLAQAVERQLSGLLGTDHHPALLLPQTDKPLPPPLAIEGGEPEVSLLIVDDSEPNRLLLKELIEGPSRRLTLASSGEEAIALAQQQDFDMVLMDIRMKGIDGVEATQALRRISDSWRERPIIAVTAHVLESQRRELLQKGIDDVLIKPLDPAHLDELLQIWLGISLHTGKPASPTSQPQPTTPSPGKGDDLPIVDLQLGTRVAGGREALAKQLIASLAASLDATQQDIDAAIEQDDEEALLDAIHGLNGACRYCGVPRLALLVETIETRLRSRGMQDTMAMLPDLTAAMQQLQQWQQQHGSETEAPEANASTSTPPHSL